MEREKKSEKDCATLKYNREISEKEKHNPKHKLFLQWCLDNGLKWTGVDFPAYFGEKGELRGVVTTRDIKPYEVILAIPIKIIMTTKAAREDPELSKMFDEEDEIFSEDDTGDYNVLIAFLMKEKMKGHESFYFPFLNLMNEFETGLVWTEETISFIEDPNFKECVQYAQLETEDEWKKIRGAFEKYPQIFPKYDKY
jgi:hypothetical protein